MRQRKVSGLGDEPQWQAQSSLAERFLEAVCSGVRHLVVHAWWSELMLNMYLTWCRSHSTPVNVLHVTEVSTCTDVQRNATAAVSDGYAHPHVQKLARLGACGKHRQNFERDLHRFTKKITNMPMDCLHAHMAITCVSRHDNVCGAHACQQLCFSKMSTAEHMSVGQGRHMHTLGTKHVTPRICIGQTSRWLIHGHPQNEPLCGIHFYSHMRCLPHSMRQGRQSSP